MTHSKVTYKYLPKTFYKGTNKKEYKSQIFIHNIGHTNVIAIQNAILMTKILDGNVKKKQLVIDTPDAKIT